VDVLVVVCTVAKCIWRRSFGIGTSLPNCLLDKCKHTSKKSTCSQAPSAFLHNWPRPSQLKLHSCSHFSDIGKDTKSNQARRNTCERCGKCCCENEEKVNTVAPPLILGKVDVYSLSAQLPSAFSVVPLALELHCQIVLWTSLNIQVRNPHALKLQVHFFKTGPSQANSSSTSALMSVISERIRKSNQAHRNTCEKCG